MLNTMNDTICCGYDYQYYIGSKRFSEAKFSDNDSLNLVSNTL